MFRNLFTTPDPTPDPVFTQNGAISLTSTNNECNDFLFKTIRGITSDFLLPLLEKAYEKDPLITRRLIFYIRDITQGKGEKKIFYECIKWLYENDRDNCLINIQHIKTFGCWKDYLQLMGIHKQFDNILYDNIIQQLNQDYIDYNDNKPISLLVKWLPTENTFFDKKLHFVTVLCKKLKIDKKTYRKKYLVPLREYLKITEKYICVNEFDKINYSTVPSQCMFKNKKVFKAKDLDRFQLYLDNVTKGTEKINTGTLMIHQIVEKYINCCTLDETYELQWKSIVNNIKKSGVLNSVIPVCDVSGSMGCMGGLPLNVCISLGLLISEIVDDNFKNNIITFSSEPEFCEIKGNTLLDRIKCLKRAKWNRSTNFEKVFELILKRCIKLEISDLQTPKSIIVFSDMQFNSAGPITNFDKIKQLYSQFGYTMPKMIFWNLNGNTVDFPATTNDNVLLLSGFNQNILKNLIDKGYINTNMMLNDIFNSERYSCIM